MQNLGQLINFYVSTTIKFDDLCKFFFKSSLHVLFLSLLFSLSVGGASPQHIILKLSVMLNKFCDPTTLTAEDFFSRWKQLAMYVTNL